MDEAPPDAVLAMNAGQFTAGPWGWLVRDGIEEARRERIDTILRHLRDGVVAVDSEERVESMNPAMERILEGSNGSREASFFNKTIPSAAAWRAKSLWAWVCTFTPTMPVRPCSNNPARNIAVKMRRTGVVTPRSGAMRDSTPLCPSSTPELGLEAAEHREFKVKR